MKGWFVRAAWAALAVVAGLTTWLFVANRPHPSAPRTAARQTPDYQLHDARITRFAADGTRRYVLLATTVVHLPVGGNTELTAIDLHYFPGSDREWRLLADHGVLGAAGDHLALVGSVHATEIAVPDPVRFAAPRVEAFLDRHRLSSDARVTVWQAGRETQGTGMLADLRAGTLTLLKNVTSRYAH